MINTAQNILKNTFGYTGFRPLQKEIIQNVLIKKDTLVIMPTGGGKSLCYQIPALIFDGLTVVVSPLISLMKDQVEQLIELGVDAVFLNSSLPIEEYQINMEKIRRNHVKLLYVAPETLLLERTLELLTHINVDCITIDEAHCISEWGHDFRPEYRRIAELRNLFSTSAWIALTATATPLVQNDIIASLKLKNAGKFVASFNRENLFLQVTPKHDPLSQTIEFLKMHPNQSGIIYCFSRKQVDDLYEELEYRGFPVKPYHAGLSDEERKKHQEQFIRDDIQIIVATIAFGMGINKPNVRFVIHYDLPKNVESYYQEIGRSGRDGLRAHCLLLFSYGDIRKINYFIDQKEEKEKRTAKLHLEALIRFAESYVCRRIPLLNYFGEEYSQKNCGMCDNCNSNEVDLVDVTIEAQKFLSCIKRTGEIFGAVHIIEILRGSNSQKLKDKNHHLLSTYGIGKELSKEQWLNLSRQFLSKNLITKDLEYGSLKITKIGFDALAGKGQVLGKLQEEEIKFIPKPAAEFNYDNSLFEILRSKRKEIADKANIPPYAIFHDKSLIEMAAYLPGTENEFLRIHGVGSAKLNKYGSVFLKIIRNYCEQNKLSIEQNAAGRKVRSKPRTEKTKSYQLTGKMYSSGKEIEEILKEFNIKFETFLSHLHKYFNDGNEVAVDGLYRYSNVTLEQKKKIVGMFNEIGTDRLKPIFESLNEPISYRDLHIIRLSLLIEQRKKK